MHLFSVFSFNFSFGKSFIWELKKNLWSCSGQNHSTLLIRVQNSTSDPTGPNRLVTAEDLLLIGPAWSRHRSNTRRTSFRAINAWCMRQMIIWIMWRFRSKSQRYSLCDISRPLIKCENMSTDNVTEGQTSFKHKMFSGTL